MKIFSLLLLVFLAACAIDDLVKVADPYTVTITWDRRAPRECGAERASQTRAIHGCAYRSRDRSVCRIVMPENAPEWVISHEFRHCFGYEHTK